MNFIPFAIEEYKCPALRCWRARFTAPFMLESRNFLTFAAGKYEFRCLQLERSIIMPSAVGEHEFPALCNRRARVSCPLPLESTDCLPFATGEHDFLALCLSVVFFAVYNWKARYPCPLPLESASFLPLAIGEHEFPALHRWRPRISCLLPLGNRISLLFARFAVCFWKT